MTKSKLLETIRAKQTRLVRFLYCDLGGLIRGKATHVQALERRLNEGIGLTKAMMAMNSLDHLATIAEMSPVGEVRLVPDPATFVPLPYVPNSASMLCDMITYDRSPWIACPRTFLKRMIGRAAEKGITIQAAFESEFYLGKYADNAFVPLDHYLCFSSIGMDSSAQFTDELLAAFEQQSIAVEQYYVEYGPGQQELSISHAPALRAADNQLITRETIRGVARRHDLLASFAPKPLPETVGSGAHLHFSLWDKEGARNLLYDAEAPHGLSTLGRQFMAGVLAHLPALVALTCASVNSYRRLQPHTWSSCYVCYGFDNREAPLRIASPFWDREMASSNLEMKTVDHTANPYLALGGLIAAGLDGIERNLDPGEAVEVDPANLSASEREQRGIERLPESLEAALAALHADTVLTAALGELLSAAYQVVKQSEVDAYRSQDLAYEIEHHLYTY